MENNCPELHRWLNAFPTYRFPFDESKIPKNGLYILFEKGERAHGVNRIVRVGTHVGQDRLRLRLKQHFLLENKNRSIFRKNIGRAILNKAHDPFLKKWELDLTSRAAKNKHPELISSDKQKAIEEKVSRYIRSHFSFVVIPVEKKKERLEFESKIISTVSRCDVCEPSKNWLGSHSPKKKIRDSGLWLVNELYKKPLSGDDLRKLRKFAA